MALHMPKSLKPDTPGATLRPRGRESFVAPIEAVRMDKTADATAESGSMPQRLAIDVRNVSLTFETADGKVDALSNVSLQVADGEFVSFIGPSGCGKTTMLRVIADLQQPTAGTLLVNGMSAEQARLARRYGYVFQAPALFPWRTIEKNLRLPLEVMGFPIASSGGERRVIWRWSISPASSASSPGNCPAVCSSGSRLRARCRSIRRCC